MHNIYPYPLNSPKQNFTSFTDMWLWSDERNFADDLSWPPHIDNTTKKANQTLGFLKRNQRVHNKDLKSVAYKTLVRPQLEYASTVWYLHHDKDINKVEAVQRRAARWATRDYKYTSSVTAMLKDLNWRPLDQRRIDSRLLMTYKVTYDLVAIPALEYLVRNTFTLWPIDRSIHSKTITGSNFPPELSSTRTPSLPIRRDVPVGVPLDLSTPTGISCIGTYGENCKSDNVSKYRVLLVAYHLL